MSSEIKQWMFPAGERGVKVPVNDQGQYTGSAELTLKFTGSDSIIDLMLQVDAVRRLTSEPLTLYVPYFPYARQDRVMAVGESHSLKVIANLINSLGFSKVTVCDPHSDVTEALVNNLEILPQEILVRTSVPNLQSYDYIIAPDAGALKKIYKLAKAIKKPVICCQKLRDVSTGDIICTTLYHEEYMNLINSKALVVDDICDGGRTFIELQKALPSTCAVDLYVTHGIFSKGKQVLSAYNQIFCYNNMQQQAI